jgi:anti-sigma-K factor RskA
MTSHPHDRFDEAAASYALDALDPSERVAFEDHLASCDRCQQELAALRRVTTGLGLAVDPVTPPEGLKARTIARATSQPQPRVSKPAPAPLVRSQRPLSWSGLAVAAGVLVAIAASLYAWSLRNQVRDLRESLNQAADHERELRSDLAAARLDAARLIRTLDVVRAPDVLLVKLEGSGAAKTATGQAYWSHTRGLIVSAQGLPALQPGRSYQLWMVPAGQSPISAGVFKVGANGAVTFEATVPAGVVLPERTAITVAVTEEPDQGSPGPTSAILLAGTTTKPPV